LARDDLAGLRLVRPTLQRIVDVAAHRPLPRGGAFPRPGFPGIIAPPPRPPHHLAPRVDTRPRPAQHRANHPPPPPPPPHPPPPPAPQRTGLRSGPPPPAAPPPHPPRDRPAAPALASLMSYHWVRTELHAVGMPAAALAPALPPDERVRRSIPYLKRMRNTAMA